MTKQFLLQIPFLLKAKEPKQWRDVLHLIYNADNDNVINSFDRKTDRYYLLSRMEIPFYMHWKRKYILDILNIMNYSHKENNLTDMQKIDLAKTVRRVERKDSKYSDVPMSASKAKDAGWSY